MALRPVLYRLFPQKINRYVEVFGGSAALLFGRNPQKGVVEVYNNLNGDLVNLLLSGIKKVIFKTVYAECISQNMYRLYEYRNV